MRQKIQRLVSALLLAILIGCKTAPSHGQRPEISLDAAKNMIVAGQVQSIFQPHQGCVLLRLKDGRTLTFEQPHLDWVLLFVSDRGLSDVIPIAVE
ncbi:MAG: hypothetical protein ACREP7_22370 [Lysobacter sp.]